METWEQFTRYRTTKNFYACVDSEGRWFDSAQSFRTAVLWCFCQVADADVEDDTEMAWMETEGKALGLSIIHSTMLRKMWEAGLIK